MREQTIYEGGNKDGGRKQKEKQDKHVREGR